MNWNIFLAELGRLPVNKLLEKFRDRGENLKGLQIMWTNQLINKLEARMKLREKLDEAEIFSVFMGLKGLIHWDGTIGFDFYELFQIVNHNNPMLVVEVIENLEEWEIMFCAQAIFASSARLTAI